MRTSGRAGQATDFKCSLDTKEGGTEGWILGGGGQKSEGRRFGRGCCVPVHVVVLGEVLRMGTGTTVNSSEYYYCELVILPRAVILH